MTCRKLLEVGQIATPSSAKAGASRRFGLAPTASRNGLVAHFWTKAWLLTIRTTRADLSRFTARIGRNRAFSRP
jgi:hypothetical protein